MTDRVVCVVPAFRAAATVAGVVSGLRAELPAATIIAIDDGSTDDTRVVASTCCDEVIGFDENRGKGAALRAGFHAALARGATAIVTIDADGQHDPAAAPRLLGALAGADLVIGSRIRVGTAMPFHRRATNALSSRAVSAAVGCEVADAQSGYRAVRAAVVQAIDAVGDRYEFETDFLIRAGQAGFRIACVPVPTLYGAPSHFRLVRDAVRVIGTIWRHHLSTRRHAVAAHER